jgi:hypothetical protein
MYFSVFMHQCRAPVPSLTVVKNCSEFYMYGMSTLQSSYIWEQQLQMKTVFMMKSSSN